VEVNYIHGLHALLQQLIDQGRMPIPDAVQKVLAQSRGQLHQIIRAAEQGEGANLQSASPNNNARAAYRLLNEVYHHTKVVLSTELRLRIAEFFRDTSPVA
jgi:ribosomal 50S subunit-associated protein YjgA (DUF615 family)